MRPFYHSLLAILAMCVTVCVSAQGPQAGFPIIDSADIFTHPTIADIDGDGFLEIVVGSWTAGLRVYGHQGNLLPGWPVAPPDGAIRYQPAVGDIDGDGDIDFVFEVSDYSVFSTGSILALSSSGEVKAGWPVSIPVTGNHDIEFLALGDLDGDGADEVVTVSDLCCDFEVYAFSGDGQVLPGWPVALPWDWTQGEIYVGDLAVGDIDFDGTVDVVVTFLVYNPFWSDSPSYVIKGDGTIRDGWPVIPTNQGYGIFLMPMLADLDGDFRSEISGTGIWQFLSFRGNGTFRYNPPHGLMNMVWPPACGDIDGDGNIEIVAGGFGPIRILEPAQVGYGMSVVASTEGYEYYRFKGFSIGDVTGDGIAEIAAWSSGIQGASGFAVHLFDADLQELPGWPKVYSINHAPWFYWGTAMADLDNDGDVEIIYTVNDTLYVWDEPRPGPEPIRIEWPMLRGGPKRGNDYHATHAPQPLYLRGDADRDGQLTVADPVATLALLFGGPADRCPAQVDFDQSGEVDLADPISALEFLFLSGDAPGAPYPDCGPPPAGEELPCREYICP